LCEAVAEALFEIFYEKNYADKVIEKALKKDRRWGARDRAFIASNTYDIVRYGRLYWEILGYQPKKVPGWWQILGIHLMHQGHILPNWKEFSGLKDKKIQLGLNKKDWPLKIKESIPDWMDTIGNEVFKEKWDPIIHALNEPAKVVLRTNTLLNSREDLKTALAHEGIETYEIGEEGLVLKERKNVFKSEAFKEGWFEMQDASSQKVGHFLEVEPGMRVIDACAGAGGKSLHLAALMKNKGQIISMDTEGWKLKELAKRAKRAHAFLIQGKEIENNKTIKRLEKSADRLLLDVPCTGMGVLRRNPDAKWKLSPKFLEEVQVTQKEILENYSKMVKPGGKMVYATCSILPRENEDQVNAFLEENNHIFELEKQETILPHEEGFDGFFMALLKRKD
jgi:16S rRNA (cytosine967-C5)-methyltransferase